jgi:hypothetical protein
MPTTRAENKEHIEHLKRTLAMHLRVGRTPSTVPTVMYAKQDDASGPAPAILDVPDPAAAKVDGQNAPGTSMSANIQDLNSNVIKVWDKWLAHDDEIEHLRQQRTALMVLSAMGAGVASLVSTMIGIAVGLVVSYLASVVF